MRSSLYLILITLVVLGLAVAVWFFSRTIQTPMLGIQIDAEVIDLRGRGLTSLPAEIGNYTRATDLLLDDNKLTGALPAEVGRMSNLKVLSARNNELTGIPAEVGKLTRLQLLDLSGNKVSTYPSELQQLRQQLVFDLTGNPLTADQLADLSELMPEADIRY